MDKGDYKTIRKFQVASVAMTSGIAVGVSRHILPVIYPSMQGSLGMGYSHLGLLTSAYFFSYMLLSLVCGYWSDRISSRLIISIGCLICAIGALGTGFSKGFVSLFGFSLITGIGAGGVYVPTTSSILKWLENRKGLMVSLVLVGEGVLGIFVGLAIPPVLTFHSWRHVWWLFGLLLLIFTLFLWWATKNTDPNRDHSRSQDEQMLSFLQVIKLPKIRSLGLVYFLHALTRGIFVTFYVTYLVSKGAAYGKATAAFSFLAMGFIPGAIVSGFLSDRVSPKSLLTGLLILQIVSISLLLLYSEWLMVYGFVIGAGFCATGVPTVFGVLPSRYFRVEVYGKVLGFLTLMLGLGVVISPALGGFVGDFTKSLFGALFLAVVASFIALCLTILKV